MLPENELLRYPGLEQNKTLLRVGEEFIMRMSSSPTLVSNKKHSMRMRGLTRVVLALDARPVACVLTHSKAGPHAQALHLAGF